LLRWKPGGWLRGTGNSCRLQPINATDDAGAANTSNSSTFECWMVLEGRANCGVGGTSYLSQYLSQYPSQYLSYKALARIDCLYGGDILALAMIMMRRSLGVVRVYSKAAR
jgi:hypothetical protein